MSSPSPRAVLAACSLRLTLHAKDRLRERGIALDELRRTVLRGTLEERGGVWVAEDAVFRIVFRLAPCNIFIVTAMYRRT